MGTYNITDHGAAADGTVSTAAIQRAIDMCDKGGTVVIPAGTFISGALFLKSNMTLRLEEGAVLMGSGNIADYPVMGYPYEGFDQLCYASLINTDSAPHENITIEGSGTINANGCALFDAELADDRIKRGRAVCIRGTKNLSLRGVTIRQSPAWCLHIIYCSDVDIDGIEIQSKYDEKGNAYGMHNCDGIDVDSCRNVHIANSLISSQDDCIAVKSGRDEFGRRAGIPSEDILIENCRFTSGFGVAVGSEMSGGVRNVTVRDCEFTDTHSIASVKAVRGRGSYVKNICYERCTLVNRSAEFTDTKWFRGAIYVDGFYGSEEFDPDTPAEVNEGTPAVYGIYFKDITVDTAAGRAVYMCGLPESIITNVSLENVKAKGVGNNFVKNVQCTVFDVKYPDGE